MIGQLDARVSATSVRSVWRKRASWIGFAAARRAQGAEIDEIDIFALDCGTSPPRRRPVAFAEEELAALRVWQANLAKVQAPHWRELIPVTLDLPPDWGERPALLRALELTAQVARVDRSATPWLGTPALFKALGIARAPLPCLVVADKALRLAPRDREAIVPRYLKALTTAAEAGIDRLNGAEADRARAASAIARTFRPGKLIELATLMQRRPLLSPVSVARGLGLSLSGAGKLLARAANEGLLIEISGRSAWRTYIAPDLAVAYDYVRRPVGRPSALPTFDMLDPALTRFDQEMADIDARLRALGVYGDDDQGD